MCGIAGWLELGGEVIPEGGEVLRRMCHRLFHRGPDSEGYWSDGKVFLGMRRLSIIDLHTGDQPVFSENDQVVAIMNGEIYNFLDLRENLERQGHRFSKKCDTEVLPHLYEEFGDGMLQLLNGMFAFALWDRSRQRLLIGRDRFGEKPLYYGVFDKKLIFASEPKALLSHPSVIKELDLQALRYYLSFDYVPAPFSIYKNIKKLPASHFLLVENGEIKIIRYWNPSYVPKAEISLEEASEELSYLLTDSIRMRLISDVPLGVLLSGGIDSSTVAALASLKGKIKTFSISFKEESFDESHYARLVAKHLGTEHYEECLDVDKACNLVSSISKWLDEPLSDGSLIPTYLLSSFVRQHVKVALGGDGGDEIFAGYPMYFGHRLAKIYEKLPSLIKKSVIEPLVYSLPVSTRNLSFDYKAKRFVSASEYDLVARHHLWFGSFSLKEQELLLNKDILQHTDGDIYEIARQSLKDCDAIEEIEKMQFLDMKFYLAEDILAKVDRASMAVSLEVRAPMLDWRIQEFVARLPLKYKLRNGSGKVILKKAMKKYLPAEILNRPKKGFGMPIARWLNGSLRDLVDDLLNPARLKRQGLFNEQFVQRLIEEHRSGKASHHKQIWTLLIFQLWFDEFLSKG
jgi:asparagine synthase (glutamine-hydrolysing)